jgi:adenosylcobinamide kinase/adenosylcobinamide-phosphate guanylyltransferase
VATYRRVLVLGGARSGKSRLALDLAERSGLAKVLIATAEAFDDEMRIRILHHRRERDSTWRVREEPYALPDAVVQESGTNRVVVVDCLTLWLSNLMLAGGHADDAAAALSAALGEAKGPVILVSNEVGQGIVPATPMGRGFRDAQGRLNRQAAAACDAVIAVTAGCPILVKPAPPLDVRLG